MSKVATTDLAHGVEALEALERAIGQFNIV